MTKKFVAFMVVLVLLAGTCWSAAKVELNVGITQSTLITSYEEAKATGFRLGVGPGFRLSKSLSLQPEISFVRKGTGTATPPWRYPGLVSRIWIDYLEVPVMIREQLGRSRKISPFFQAGGYGAWRVGARGVTRHEGSSLSESYDADIRDFDFGLVAGLGAEVRVGKRPWLVEVRYDLGMSDVNQREMVNGWRNSTLSLLLGIRI